MQSPNLTCTNWIPPGSPTKHHRKFAPTFVNVLLLVITAVAAEPITVPLERETLIIPGGLEGWDLAWHGSLVNMHTLEWVPSGETVENWTELFTVQRIMGETKNGADAFAAEHLNALQKDCPNLEGSILESSHQSTTYEWKVKGCANADNQHEFSRSILSGDYMFRISYSRKGDVISPDVRTKWISVLESIQPVHCCEADDAGLSQIPLMQLYESFHINVQPGMKLSFDDGRLVSTGFPADHVYDCFLISLSPTKDFYAMPIAQGLVADETGALRCPSTRKDQEAENAVLDGGYNICAAWEPGSSLSGLNAPRGVQFQKGLSVAYAVRTRDGNHATYAKFTPRPIEGNHKSCLVSLELASTDARTFVAYGSGFPTNDQVALSWKYGGNQGTSTAQTDSQGEFVAAINHPGKAVGSGKWKAMLEATSGRCRVKVKYKWGTAGMQP